MTAAMASAARTEVRVAPVRMCWISVRTTNLVSGPRHERIIFTIIVFFFSPHPWPAAPRVRRQDPSHSPNDNHPTTTRRIPAT
jgi:hypothetical protein